MISHPPLCCGTIEERGDNEKPKARVSKNYEVFNSGQYQIPQENGTI